MKRFITVACATAGLVVLAASSAHAGDPVAGPTGSTCGFESVGVAGSFTGEMEGGPYLGDGTLTCTIQVGGPTHGDDDTVARSASNTTVVVLNPTVVTYEVPPGSSVYICTQWTPAGGDPIYWHRVEGGGSHWSADPATPCILATEGGADGNDFFRTTVDPLVCPVFPVILTGTLATLVTVTPEGDVYVAGVRVWDCPPYGN